MVLLFLSCCTSPCLASSWQSNKTNCVNNYINLLLHVPKPQPGRGDQLNLQLPLTPPFYHSGKQMLTSVARQRQQGERPIDTQRHLETTVRRPNYALHTSYCQTQRNRKRTQRCQIHFVRNDMCSYVNEKCVRTTVLFCGSEGGLFSGSRFRSMVKGNVLVLAHVFRTVSC